MSVIDKVRDYVEEKVDRVHEYREDRKERVEDKARAEYHERRKEIYDKEQSGQISHRVAAKRIERAVKKRAKHEVPVENRVGRVGKEIAAGWVDRQKTRMTRKSAYGWVSGGARSYNKSVPSAFGLGTGKGKRRSQDKSNWSMLTGSGGKSSGGGGFGSGFAMLNGGRGGGSSSRRKRGRGGSGGGGSDNFWMLG